MPSMFISDINIYLRLRYYSLTTSLSYKAISSVQRKLFYFVVFVAVTALPGITVLKEAAAEAIEIDEEVAALSESESSGPISTRVRPGVTLLKQ